MGTQNNDFSNTTKNYYRQIAPLPPSLQRITLIPDNIPVHLGSCGDSIHLQKGWVIILAGHNAVVTGAFPVGIMSIGGRPVLVIDRANNKISIKELLLVGDDFNELVHIGDDKIWINPLVRAELVGKSELTLYVGGDKIFDLWYVNKDTLMVMGKFRYKADLNEYDVGYDSIILRGRGRSPLEMSGNCFKDFGTINSIFPAG